MSAKPVQQLTSQAQGRRRKHSIKTRSVRETGRRRFERRGQPAPSLTVEVRDGATYLASPPGITVGEFAEHVASLLTRSSQQEAASLAFAADALERILAHLTQTPLVSGEYGARLQLEMLAVSHRLKTLPHDLRRFGYEMPEECRAHINAALDGLQETAAALSEKRLAEYVAMVRQAHYFALKIQKRCRMCDLTETQARLRFTGREARKAIATLARRAREDDTMQEVLRALILIERELSEAEMGIELSWLDPSGGA